MPDDNQGALPEQSAPTAPALYRRKGVVAGTAVVAVLAAGGVIAVTSSGSSAPASVNSLPGATAGAASAAGDDNTTSFVQFQLYPNSAGGKGADASGYLPTESQVKGDHPSTEVDSADFDIEQTLNIGSQSSGAGAGKVTFNPLSLSMKVDRNAPTFLQMAASGTPFQVVNVLVKPNGQQAQATALGKTSVPIVYTFKLVAIKTVAFDGSLMKMTLEYGGVQVKYAQQSPDGKLGQPLVGGWNRVKNVQDSTDAPIN